MTDPSTWPPRGMREERVDVLDSFMACVRSDDEAAQPTLLFLHGNPTSSYLWRHVLAWLGVDHHCVAVDLIGMGRSGKPGITYGYGDHLRYLEAFIERMHVQRVIIVGHDWGGVLALDIARRQRAKVVGVAICESHLQPWPPVEELDAATREMFEPLRTPGARERMLLQENLFIEEVLPGGMLRRLDDDDWAHYREPFPTPDSRRPILEWVQQIPIGGRPAEVDATVRANVAALSDPSLPSLLLLGNPGSVVSGELASEIAAHCPAMTVRNVGSGTHFLPEDCGAEIARAVADWSATIE